MSDQKCDMGQLCAELEAEQAAHALVRRELAAKQELVEKLVEANEELANKILFGSMYHFDSRTCWFEARCSAAAGRNPQAVLAI